MAITLSILMMLGASFGSTPWNIQVFTNTTDLAALAAPANVYKVMLVGNLDGGSLYFATNTISGTNTTTRIASALQPTWSWDLIGSLVVNYVPSSRAINTLSPLTGGGDLSVDLTLSIPQATSVDDGYLAATDWIIFNNKQAALTFTNGVTNISDVISADLAAGSNITFSTNNGRITITGSAAGTTINPTDGVIPVRVNSTTFGDSSISTNGTNIVIAGDLSLNSQTNLLTMSGGFLKFDGVNIATGTGGTVGTMINTTSDAIGDVPYATDTTKTNWAPAKSFTLDGTTNGTVNGQLIFGPGTTNNLVRSGTDLIYTNGATSDFFTLKRGSGASASFGVNTSGNAGISSSSGSLGIVNTGGGSTLITYDNSDTTTFSEGAAIVQRGAIGSANPSSSYGFIGNNPTAATSGAQQNSPALTLVGNGWSTNNSLSEQVLFSEYVTPSPGSTHPSGILLLRSQITSTNSSVTNLTVTSDSIISSYGTADASGFYAVKTNDSLTFSAIVPRQIYISSAGAATLNLFPDAGISSTAYTFDTADTHTSGDLFEILNQNFTEVTFDYQGNETLQGYISLSNQTNRLTMASGQLKLDGVALGTGSGGGTVGTMINTTTTVVGNVPYATDTLKTNWAPSGAFTLDASTNATLKGNLTANGGAFTNSLTLGGTAVALSSTTISAGNGMSGGGDLSGNRTLTLAPTAWTSSSFTIGDSSQASITFGFGLSGATDPVFTVGNNSMDLTTGVLKYAGNTVATSINDLSFFAATSSAQLRGVLSDESGTGAAIFAGGAIGAATATTASAGDSSTLVATTALVSSTETSTHASPSTTNPLSPTWTGPMHIVWYGATGTINLPAASGYAERGILVYNTGAFTITIDANGSEVIVRDGVVQTGGVSMTLSTGAGNYVALICDGARWITVGFKGTLAVGS